MNDTCAINCFPEYNTSKTYPSPEDIMMDHMHALPVRGPPLPRNLPLQSSRSNLMIRRNSMTSDLAHVQEESEHDCDDNETVVSEFEYSIKDGIRFLKSVEVEDKNEAIERMVRSLYKKIQDMDSDSVTVLTNDTSARDAKSIGTRSTKLSCGTSVGVNSYATETTTASTTTAPAVVSECQAATDAFHHGLDKDELMSMVQVLTKQSTFSDMLYNNNHRAMDNSLKSQHSFRSQAKSTKSKASSAMPSLTDHSSLASSCLSRALSRSVNSRTPVINKNQLFAMRREDRVHVDSLPQQPARRVTEFSDSESMTSYQEDDLESLLSRNSSIKAPAHHTHNLSISNGMNDSGLARAGILRMVEQRSSFDRVPQQPMRRQYSDVESGDDESLLSRPSVASGNSQGGRRRVVERANCPDRMPRFPQRSLVSLSDGESLCTMSLHPTPEEEEEEEKEEEYEVQEQVVCPAPVTPSIPEISVAPTSTPRPACEDALPHPPRPSTTPETSRSATRERTCIDSVPVTPAVTKTTTPARAAVAAEEFWEFPEPVETTCDLLTPLAKLWKMVNGKKNKTNKADKSMNKQAKVEDFLPADGVTVAPGKVQEEVKTCVNTKEYRGTCQPQTSGSTMTALLIDEDDSEQSCCVVSV